VVSNKSLLQKYYERALVNNLGSQTEGLLQGLSFDLKIPTQDDFITLDLKGLGAVPSFYDKSGGTRVFSLVLTPELDIQPIDSFHIVAGCDLAYSWIRTSTQKLELYRSDSIGSYTCDNVCYISCRWTWNGNL
jgi:hypothetical protein